MSKQHHSIRWQVCDDSEAVAQEAARRILAAAQRAIARQGVFRIVLAGGGTPRRAYQQLVAADTDWSCWQIFFGDERCLPVENEERNSRMASTAWLEHIAIAPENVHPIPAELGAEPAAEAYMALVAEARPFDLVLLGMGEDGHTASLFPGQTHDAKELVHAVHGAPKPPPDRVSLSAGSLSDAREVLVLITGDGKRDAVRRWKREEPLPVASITGLYGVDVLLDRAANA